jgi:broad specificity phosphatase PhoE
VADLSRALSSEGIQRVISSDLLRALETASILAEVWSLDPSRDSRFRELDVGVWTGLTREEIEEREGEALRRFDRGEPDLLAGGGESRRQLRLRVRAAAAEIAARHPGERVALVTHLGVVRALVPGTDLDNAGWCRASAHELATVEQALG